MIEFVSDMSRPQFGDEYSIVRGSELVQCLNGTYVSFCFMQDVFAYTLRCFRVPPGLRIPRAGVLTSLSSLGKVL
jgi:hypothetical protein